MTLLYTPFIDPINIHQYWYLLLFPLALGVSVAYKAVRIPDIKLLPRHALTMTAQIVLAMIALGAASYLFVQHVVPLIAPK